MQKYLKILAKSTSFVELTTEPLENDKSIIVVSGPTCVGPVPVCLACYPRQICPLKTERLHQSVRKLLDQFHLKCDIDRRPGPELHGPMAEIIPQERSSSAVLSNLHRNSRKTSAAHQAKNACIRLVPTANTPELFVLAKPVKSLERKAPQESCAPDSCVNEWVIPDEPLLYNNSTLEDESVGLVQNSVYVWYGQEDVMADRANQECEEMDDPLKQFNHVETDKDPLGDIVQVVVRRRKKLHNDVRADFV